MIRIDFLLGIILIFGWLTPLGVLAETTAPTCQTARDKLEQAQNLLRPLELEQDKTQKRVRQIYQTLLLCHSTNMITPTQTTQCQQLEQEAPQQFQHMIQLVKASHQASLELETQATQVKQACPAPAAAPITHISQLAIR